MLRNIDAIMRLKFNRIIILFIGIVALGFSFPSAWMNITSEEMLKFFEQQNKILRETVSYSVQVEHASYEDHATITPHENSVGYFKKDGSNYHSFLLGVHTIQNSKIKVVIDSSGKKIMVSDPDKSFEQNIFQEQNMQQITLWKSYKKRNENTGTAYRVEYKDGCALEAVEWLINQENILGKFTMYYSVFDWKENWKAKPVKYRPRLEIKFLNFKKGVKFKYTEEFDEKKYVSFDGKKYLPSKEFSEYRLFDARVKQ